MRPAPRTVIVFHGQAVKLVSTDRTGMDNAEKAAYDRVAGLIRHFKKAGIKMEVCMNAVKVLGVDPATLMPEGDRGGNGFIATLRNQGQGYSVESIP